MHLLPAPRQLRRTPGTYRSPASGPAIRLLRDDSAPPQPEGYQLDITPDGIVIRHHDDAGLRAAHTTLRQLQRQYGRRLPCLRIRDWPAFARRGLMLDISRGRVPRVETLLELAEQLANLKINELQLYTEHTFAYRRYRRVWQSWGALTGADLRRLDTRCRELGIDLVPNQNSFGHLRQFLAHPRLKPLAEIAEPYESETRDFLRFPTTLAPEHPGTLPFLRGLYDELLPNFSSQRFNIGADETWDLGKGQSRAACESRGQGQVYVDFLRQLHREVTARGKTMMFWGDIILKYPKLLAKLPRDVIALNWGYEAHHPFARETRQFARAGIPFYVCPGTSTWQTLIGRHDNAVKNLRAAARAGQASGACGYLITDWGDGGHPQPLAVSWPLYALGAALAWNPRGVAQSTLQTILDRDIFADKAEQFTRIAWELGHAHRHLRVRVPNETPLGSVIAAPAEGSRELFCRNGKKWAARLPASRIRAALREINRQRKNLQRTRPTSSAGRIHRRELELAARLAAESCHYMLWQQAISAGQKIKAQALARRARQELPRLQRDFTAVWPERYLATPAQCIPFLSWRIQEYTQSLPRKAARQTKPV